MLRQRNETGHFAELHFSVGMISLCRSLQLANTVFLIVPCFVRIPSRFCPKISKIMENSPSTSKQSSSGTGGLEMPPEVSLRLFKEGATFVLLDVPIGTEVGIDMESWNTGERFRGIKMIPPGLHFVYFSAVSKDHQNTAPRTGFFHFFEKKEFLAKQYDQRAEDISPNEVPEEDHTRMKNGMEEMDKYLGAYPYNRWRTWVSLTSRITVDTLNRLSPPSGRILSAPELTLDADQTKPNTSRRKMTKLEEAENSLPRMTENIDSKIRYTPIPSETFPVGASPQQISKFQLDRSWKLQQVIESIGAPSAYLAELQFAFVTFLVGQHYDSFEHWKALTQLLCFSDDAILKHPNLYHDFISDLYFQIREIPEDFFVDIVASNNFLFSCMQRLINNVKEHETADRKMKDKIERFSAFLSSKFDWDFEEEFEDAPTLVTEEYAIISSERSKLKRKTRDEESEVVEDSNEWDENNSLEHEEVMDIVGDLPIF